MSEETFTVVPFDAAAARSKPANADPGAVEGVAAIVQELRGLREAVEALTAAVRERPAGPVLGQAGSVSGVAPVAVRALAPADARREIQEFFLMNRGGTLYPDQIAQALGLSLSQVVETCEALAAEGRLERE